MIVSAELLAPARLGSRIPIFVPKFTHALEGKVERWDWRFIPEGAFCYEDSGGAVFAREDMVEIVGIRHHG